MCNCADGPMQVNSHVRVDDEALAELHALHAAYSGVFGRVVFTGQGRPGSPAGAVQTCTLPRHLNVYAACGVIIPCLYSSACCLWCHDPWKCHPSSLHSLIFRRLVTAFL